MSGRIGNAELLRDGQHIANVRYELEFHDDRTVTGMISSFDSREHLIDTHVIYTLKLEDGTRVPCTLDSINYGHLSDIMDAAYSIRLRDQIIYP